MNKVRLIGEALNIEASEVYKRRSFTECEKKRIAEAESACRRKIPLSRVFQERFFYRHTFYISPYCFDPRACTESLVDYVVKNLKPSNILDICTGSGCILLSLLSVFRDANGVGTDISKNAIFNAKVNSNTLKIKASFFISNFANNIDGIFDLIVSNPPYIHASYALSQEVLYDPPLSLYENGAYEAIFNDTQRLLKIGGHLILEVPTYRKLLIPNNLRVYYTEKIAQDVAIWHLVKLL